MTRIGRVSRKTAETDISVLVDLDGDGGSSIVCPLPFLAHMLEQLARHGSIHMEISAQGDTHIDGHHLTEDLGICIGQAISQALGNKSGIVRYGSCILPMDEARIAAAVDLSGRTFFVWDLPMPKAKIGEFDTELAEVFFEGLTRGLACNLHVTRERGENLHHLVEAAFKSVARSLRTAMSFDPRMTSIPSTKGSLSDEITK